MDNAQEHEYVTKTEAAEILDVTPRAIERWVQAGMLKPYRLDRPTPQPGAKPHQYRRADVQALMLARSEKTDLWHVHGLALQALSTAQQTERRLTELLLMLGCDVTPLQRDPAAVRALCTAVVAGFAENDLKSPEWLRLWGSTFFAIDETYLVLVRHVLGDEEPWKQFIDFASAVARALTTPKPALRSAIACFEAGRRHLTYVGFMSCQRLHGRDTAKRVFDRRPTAVQELVHILR